MQLNKILLLFLIVLMKPLSLYSQCESVVNQFISIEDFPIESEVFSTENSGNDFIVFRNDFLLFFLLLGYLFFTVLTLSSNRKSMLKSWAIRSDGYDYT